MNLLFTVCGRGGSKGVKNKNLKSLLNIPLLYYSLSIIDQYKKRHQEHKITAVVSTDSEELIALACSQTVLPITVVRRQGYLAGDLAPKVAVISDCLWQAEEQLSIVFDMVIDLDITSPLRTIADVEKAVEKKTTYCDMDCALSVTASRRNPYFNMIKMENEILSPVIESTYTTRQEAPVVYDMNASIYAYSPLALKNKNPIGFFATNCTAFMMKDTAVLDIDSEEDFEVMQVLARYFFDKYASFKEMYCNAVEFSAMASIMGERK